MRNGEKTKSLVRFALRCGLLMTDATVWSAVNHFLKNRSDDEQEAFRRTDASGVRTRSPGGKSHASTLLSGIGIGIGVGMVLAWASRPRAHGVIRAFSDGPDETGLVGSQIQRMYESYAK
jgi:hypothetical protein